MRGWAELTFSDLGLFMAVRGIRIARGGAFGGSWFHVMLQEMFHERAAAAAVQFLVVGTVRGGTLQKPVQCSKTRLFNAIHSNRANLTVIFMLVFGLLLASLKSQRTDFTGIDFAGRHDRSVDEGGRE